MSIRARVATLGIITGFCGSIALAAAAAECGPREDAEKASHRQLALGDFAGERPREKGRPKQGDSTSILIATAVAIDELGIDAQLEPDGRFVARVVRLCVRAYFMKQLSGRKSEMAVAWELGHEQGHFDLTQAHALELEAQVAGLTLAADSADAARQGLRERVIALYRDHAERSQGEQDRYDRETRHGHHRSVQGRWTDEIAARIARSSPAVVAVAQADGGGAGR
jgi:hypothetical protein